MRKDQTAYIAARCTVHTGIVGLPEIEARAFDPPRFLTSFQDAQARWSSPLQPEAG
jgi:hypothetical protein